MGEVKYLTCHPRRGPLFNTDIVQRGNVINNGHQLRFKMITSVVYKI